MIFNSGNIEELYKTIPQKVIVKEIPGFRPKNVVGCDVSYKGKAKVSCVAFNIEEKRIIEEIMFERKVYGEYIPTKFARREFPLIGEAISSISVPFDCVIVDGHGIAHPDKAGLACFVGVIFDLPTIGCAKNLLVGDFEDITLKRGNWADIIYRGEKVGEAVCTKKGTKPIFLSPGNKMGFQNVRKTALELAINSKYPEPLRLADLNTRFQVRLN
jgi:deoxyribonuclease V